jgi:hypothetical protein
MNKRLNTYPLYQPDGYRQLITFKSPPGMGEEELKGWIADHAERAKRLPGLKWYTLCFVFGPIDYADGTPGQPPPFDAYEEMYFDSLEDLRQAYQSNLMQSELKEMVKRGLFDTEDFRRGVWAEANIVKMKGLSSPPTQKDCARIFGGCKRAEGMSRKDLKDWYYGHAERVIDTDGRMIIPEIIGYIHNFTLEDSPFGPPFVDAYCNNWWATREDMFMTLAGEIWRGQLEHREEHIDAYDPALFIGALAIELPIDLPDEPAQAGAG